MNTDDLIKERKGQHGSWASHAETAYRLKEALRKGEHWEGMVPSQREALDMIAVKMSRIVNGNASHDDHWDDIMGYAKLGKDGDHNVG